jgi:hypothetical protein
LQPSAASPAHKSPGRITASPARITDSPIRIASSPTRITGSPARSISSIESSPGNRLQIVTSPMSIAASPSPVRHVDDAGSSLLKSLLTKSIVSNSVGQFPPPSSGFAFPPGEILCF